MLAAVSTVALCFLVPPAPSVRVHTAATSLRVAPLSMAASEAATGGAEELCDIMPASVCEEVSSSKWHRADLSRGLNAVSSCLRSSSDGV